MNRFTWGNLKSLKTHKPKDLLKDLRKFFDEMYSADRMKLVIQVKTEDRMVELKKKVVEIFSVIKNKKLGIQNFGINSKTKKIIPLPYEKNYHEVIVFNAVKNTSVLYIYFTFEPNFTHPKHQSISLYLLAQIIGHEGKGSLY